MPVIDIHEHVIPRRGFLHPARKETICTPDEMVGIMDKHDIDKAVVLPLTSPETFSFVQSVEEAFEACDRYPDRFIKFCNVDPRLDRNSLDYDFVPILEYYKSLGAKGIGEVTCNLWWHDRRLHNLLRGCNEVGFPFIFHVAWREYDMYGIISRPGLPGLEEALQKYPNITFLGHSPGWWSEVAGELTPTERQGYPKGKIKPGGRVPELMRKYPNMWGDLSAGSGYNAVTRDPEWGYQFLEEFQDKLLMGLDCCYPSNDECPLMGFLREAVAKGKISQHAFDKIMGENAVKLLGL